MMVHDNVEILASDAEREQAILQLHGACGEGRLTLDEFSDRVKAVLASRTRGQLVPITADLPCNSVVASTSAPRGPKRFTVSILSDVKRRGRWRLDGQTAAISILANCTLDLRGAVFPGNEVIIDTYVFLGAVKIIVAPGTQVELEGFAILGNRDSKVNDVENLPGAPIVRVRGMTVLGAVDVVCEDRDLASDSSNPLLLKGS